MRSNRQWHRKLWAVEFGSDKGGWHMISTLWLHPTPPAAHRDEPRRALLFCTRNKARALVSVQNAELKARGDWWGEGNRYRVVRVLESVRRV